MDDKNEHAYNKNGKHIGGNKIINILILLGGIAMYILYNWK